MTLLPFAASPTQAAPDDVCAALTAPVHLRTDPGTGSQLLTTDRAAADAAQLRDDSVAFLASTNARARLERVYHLRSANGRDAYSADRAEVAAWRELGYRQLDDGFFASPSAADCLLPVYELVRESDRQQALAITEGQRDEYLADGYAPRGVAFYAGVDRQFSLAIIPDSQQEVLDDHGLWNQRATWLAEQEGALDLRYITHVGDVVNWDTDDHIQYERTKAGVATLDATGIPWSFSIGNHDTMATTVGGSARPGESAHTNQRITKTFNRYYGVQHAKNLQGTWEADKIDNSYSTFAAGGVDWLVLNMELWPREGAIQWAKGIVASHPDHNVIVVNHSFLEGNGSVKQSNGGYGDTSPQHVLDELISEFDNIAFVFSGHTGYTVQRALTGVHGNTIHAINTTLHARNDSPTRIVQIDTAGKTFSSEVSGVASGCTYERSLFTGLLELQP
ncbi:MAG: metallophosphoesterase [Kineosporiaceae bacterium]|nr:metallophosphoesterase [Aeromicrobium sp.]